MIRFCLVALLIVPSVCLAEIKFGTLPAVKESVADIPKEAPKEVVQEPPAVKKHADVSGLHSHWCDKCKIEWWHGKENFGHEAAHKCPKCGAVVYDVHQEAKPKATKPVAVPMKAVQVQQNCPGGVCPNPAFQGRRGNGLFWSWK